MLATIVRAWGSTPREVGAKMLIDRKGNIRGTVGGGCGEGEVWQQAGPTFQDGLPRQVHVDLTESFESPEGKVCGGRFDVFMELWQPEDPVLEELARRLETAFERGEEAVLVTVLGPSGEPAWKSGPPPAVQLFPEPPVGRRLLVTAQGELVGSLGEPGPQDGLQAWAREALARGEGLVRSLPLGDRAFDVYLDPLVPPPTLVIAGAGHIARPLCAMASLCGYRVLIVDDRPEYASAHYFPSATQVICRPFVEAFRELPTGSGTHVVLVTRGHKHDEDCLRILQGRPLAYLGMIGSRRRTRAVFADLEAEGVDKAWLDRIYAPIGLDLGARTPEEIAVAILGEIIKIHRGGQASSLSLRNKR